MKKKIIIPCVSLALFLSACSNSSAVDSASKEPNQPTTSTPVVSTPTASSPTAPNTQTSLPPAPSSIPASSSAQDSVFSSETVNVTTTTSFVQTITAAGTYTLTGEIQGSILIDAPEDADVELVLNNAKIISNFNSPIYCKCANELKIKIAEGTTNYVYDKRAALDSTNEDETQGKGAIYSKADLKFTNKGSLYVEADYNNGIHCTDDVKFKNVSLNGSKIKVIAYNHAVKGNDSVTVEDGKLELISKHGSGIKTENTDISSKGNQRGTISITGGDITINSCEDAIEAAYNVSITNSPTINILTSTYSPYTEGSISSPDSQSTMYLRTSTSQYNYSVSFKNSAGVTTWANATYVSSQSSGRTTYFYYSLSKPQDAISFRTFAYRTNVTDRNETNYTAAASSYSNINISYDTVTISVGSTIGVSSWSNYNSQNYGGGGWGGPGGGMQEGNTNKADYSAKGIKANNEILISGGNINIKSYDDGIHANRGEALDNGSTGLGNLEISGGNLIIYAADDGIHADDTATISGGAIDVISSYEGVEGNIINVSGGYTRIYSTDDGLNAANKADKTPAINISGGVLDIQVYGGDVDGIDSNGAYTQTGGLVISKGGTSGMSNGLDTDGATRVNGGTLIIFGRPENQPTCGTGVSSYNLNASYAIGTYVVQNGVNSVTVTTKYAYSTVYVYSNESSRYTITKQ